MNKIHFCAVVTVSDGIKSALVFFNNKNDIGEDSFEYVNLMTSIKEFEAYKEKDKFVLTVYNFVRESFKDCSLTEDEIMVFAVSSSDDRLLWGFKIKFNNDGMVCYKTLDYARKDIFSEDIMSDIKQNNNIITEFEHNVFEINFRDDALEIGEILKPYIKNYIIDEITSYCDGKTRIRKWYDNGCPYDHSGYTADTNEFLTMDSTVADVLGNYTGRTEATYMSHYGLHHETYEETLTDFIGEFAQDIVDFVIKDYMQRGIIKGYDYDSFYFNFDSLVSDTRMDTWSEIGEITVRYSIYDEDDEDASWCIDTISILDMNLDADITVRELIKLKQELQDNPIWNKIMA